MEDLVLAGLAYDDVPAFDELEAGLEHHHV